MTPDSSRSRAVAVGAACDFLTAIGHQGNMLVMGPGGYKFSDYARFGAPALPPMFASVQMPNMRWRTIAASTASNAAGCC